MPMRSAVRSGPVGWPRQPCISASTASAVAVPSCTTRAASLIIGCSTRLVTKPGASLTTTPSRRTAASSAATAAMAASEVLAPRMTSAVLIR